MQRTLIIRYTAYIAVCICAVGLFPAIALSQEGGVDFPRAVRMEGERKAMVLRGSGVFRRNFIPYYVAALYVPYGKGDPKEVLSPVTAKKVVLVWTMPEMTKDKLDTYWMSSFRRAQTDPEKFGRMEAQIKKFCGWFSDVTKGDEYTFEYLPDAGTRVSVNGTQVGHLVGSVFNRSLLNIWLGDHVDLNFRGKLLGEK